jgi:hypothetical protein
VEREDLTLSSFLFCFFVVADTLAQMERATRLDPFFLGLNLHWGRLFFLRDEWFGDVYEKHGQRSYNRMEQSFDFER